MWSSIDGPLIPALWSLNTMDFKKVFTRGPDGSVLSITQHRNRRTGQWESFSDWTNLQQSIRLQPSVAVTTLGQVVAGLRVDGSILVLWESSGGSMISSLAPPDDETFYNSPAAAVDMWDRIVIFANGRRGLWVRRQSLNNVNPPEWSDWGLLGAPPALAGSSNSRIPVGKLLTIESEHAVIPVGRSRNGALVVFARRSDGRLFFAKERWSGQSVSWSVIGRPGGRRIWFAIPGSTKAARLPGVARHSEHLSVAFTKNTGEVFFSQENENGGFSTPISAGRPTASPPAQVPAIHSGLGEAMQIAVKGRDGSLFVTRQTAAGSDEFTEWISLGQPFEVGLGQPTLKKNFTWDEYDSLAQVFIDGSDGRIWTSTEKADRAWTPWFALPKPPSVSATRSLAITHGDDDRAVLFAIGVDGSLLRRRRIAVPLGQGDWAPWESLGRPAGPPVLTGPLTITTVSGDRLSVVAPDRINDKRYWYLSENAARNGWLEWRSTDLGFDLTRFLQLGTALNGKKLLQSTSGANVWLWNGASDGTWLGPFPIGTSGDGSLMPPGIRVPRTNPVGANRTLVVLEAGLSDFSNNAWSTRQPNYYAGGILRCLERSDGVLGFVSSDRGQIVYVERSGSNTWSPILRLNVAPGGWLDALSLTEGASGLSVAARSATNVVNASRPMHLVRETGQGTWGMSAPIPVLPTLDSALPVLNDNNGKLEIFSVGNDGTVYLRKVD